MPPNPRSILITGASSGIGRALACEYAAPGIQLALTGRDRDRMEDVAALCRDMGASVVSALIDVRDRDAITTWIRTVDNEHPIDLAIANAGITSGTGVGRPFEHPDIVRNVVATNIVGTINTIDPLVAPMRARGRGRIAIMGSLNAVRGMPYCPAYSASKAAIHVYAESLRGALARYGVGVTVIIPGFVKTPLNEDIVCPKPLQISGERAARQIRRGLDRGRAVIVFPRLLYYGLMMSRLLPPRLIDAVLASVHVHVPEKFDSYGDD